MSRTSWQCTVDALYLISCGHGASREATTARRSIYDRYIQSSPTQDCVSVAPTVRLEGPGAMSMHVGPSMPACCASPCSPFCPILSHFVPSRQARPDGQQRVQPAQEQGERANDPHHRPRRQQDGHRRRCWRAARVGRRPPRRPRPRLRRPPEPTVAGPWWRQRGLERAQDRPQCLHRRARGQQEGCVGVWPRV